MAEPLVRSLVCLLVFSMSPPLSQDKVNSVLALIDSGFSCPKIHATVLRLLFS